MRNTKRKAVVCGFIFSILFSFISFSNKCEGINNKVFRLHIIANSDSVEDQNLKLKVRDRILNNFGFEMKAVSDIFSAETITLENINHIKNLAQDEIKKNGYDYEVNAQIINMYFNTRVYGGLTIPAGNYDALRITIGKAEGKNWWCVMFPPMCLPAAQSDLEIDSVLTSSESEVVTGWDRYKIEFKIWETFVKVKELIRVDFYNPIAKFFSDSDNFEYEMSFKINEII